MSNLNIHFEWEDPCGARGPELRATWARLTILVDKTPVTRVLDRRSHSVRTAIYGPLYPLAEWVATHWWALLHEVETPGTQRQGTYPERHNLAFAQEGFALPELEFVSCGQEMILRWNTADATRANVSFLESGSLIVPTVEVREELTRFISGVVARLDAEKVSGTLLQQEWDSILACDAEERAFCETAASLGLDPFALDDADRARLVNAHAALAPEVSDEFLAAVDFQTIADAYDSLQDSIKQIKQSTTSLRGIEDLRRNHPSIDRSVKPWGQGYEFARALRAQLGLNGTILHDLNGLARAMQVDPTTLERAILTPRQPQSTFDAVVGTNDQGSPGFVIVKRWEGSRKFALCRSLYEYLTGPQPHCVALVSKAHSDRQRANRAFAAEFLAPTSLLRQRIQGDMVAEEQLDDLAGQFGVSPWVIRHQIENHDLASVASTY